MTVLTGCSVGNDVMASIGMPSSETAPAHLPSGAPQSRPPQPPGGHSDAVIVTDQQRAYLDALKVAGVRPSSDLRALRIGSYVCQARAAKQSDQEVWDLVLPLVRNDVRDGEANSMATPPPAASVNSVTADYIRIATDRLC